MEERRGPIFTVYELWSTGLGGGEHSLERWNKFSIKSIGSGSDWLPGFRAQLCLLVVWPWPNHHTSRPQFPYLLNGNNNSTSWNRAGCWAGKSTTNKTVLTSKELPSQEKRPVSSYCPTQLTHSALEVRRWQGWRRGGNQVPQSPKIGPTGASRKVSLHEVIRRSGASLRAKVLFLSPKT